MTLGQRIRAARDARHISQRVLAERLGVSKSAVAHWEDDLSRPLSRRINDVAIALSITVDELLGLGGQPQDNVAPSVPLDGDPELSALSACVCAINAIPSHRRPAVLRYLVQRYGQ